MLSNHSTQIRAPITSNATTHKCGVNISHAAKRHGFCGRAIRPCKSLILSVVGRWCLARRPRTFGDTRYQMWRELRSHCCTQTLTNQSAHWTSPAAASRILSCGTGAFM